MYWMDTDEPINFFYSVGVAVFGSLLCLFMTGYLIWLCISMPFMWVIVGFWAIPISIYLAIRALRMLKNRRVPVITITEELISFNEKSHKKFKFCDIAQAEIKVTAGNLCFLDMWTRSGDEKQNIKIGLNPIDVDPSELINLIRKRIDSRRTDCRPVNVGH